MRETLFDADAAAGLLDRFHHRGAVHRTDRAQVDHLRLDALLGERLGRLQGVGHADGEGDDGDVLAGAVNARLADRQDEVVDLRHREGLAVENLVLEEDHRVGIADRRLEQALRVGGGVGRDHLEARHVGVPRGVVVAVLGADTSGGAVGAAEHDRTAELAAGHVQGLGRRVDDVVDRLHGEVEGHELDDGLEPHEGGTDADAGESVLGDRGIDHAARAELLQQPLRNLVGALVLGDLLAHHEDGLVLAHLLGHGVPQGLAHGHGLHRGVGGKLFHHRIGRLVGDDGGRGLRLRRIVTALGGSG